MSKEFTRTAMIVGILTIVTPLLFGISALEDLLAGIAISALFYSVMSLPVGLILTLMRDSRPYGQALLLCSGILLLASFTLCSTGVANIHI
jgi:hypothetical protein